MAGTKEGGKRAAPTNKDKYGDDFYARIGAKGGRNGHTGGFAANPELAKLAGAKGGKISKRGKARKMSAMVNFSDEAKKSMELYALKVEYDRMKSPYERFIEKIMKGKECEN